MTQLHWFVKIPRSLQTVAMDERELVMYNTIFPKLKHFIQDNLKPGIFNNCRDCSVELFYCRRKVEFANTNNIFFKFHG